MKHFEEIRIYMWLGRQDSFLRAQQVLCLKEKKKLAKILNWISLKLKPLLFKICNGDMKRQAIDWEKEFTGCIWQKVFI